MSDPPPRSTGSGMMSGLYANLLGSSSANSSASISAAPIVFSQSQSPDPTTDDAAAQKKAQINAAALRFQPTIHKRPVPNTKPKPKPHISAPPTGPGGSAAPSAAAGAASGGQPHVVEPPKIVAKTTLDDWMDDGTPEDVNGFYAGKRAGGRKKRKKNRATPPPPTNWDDPYDPGRPNSYEEYREGEEKVREMSEWREKLYGRRRGRRRGSDSSESSSDGERRGGLGMGMANRFAPPKSYSFAPPPSLSAPPPPPPSSAPAVEIPDDVSGEDAFARRLRMSQQGAVGYSSFTPPPPPPAPSAQPPPPPPPSSTISAAPVRYSNPNPPSPPPAPRSPSPPSSRPGQKDFARRLMEAQGWKSGQGLGRTGDGITKAITMVTVSKKGKGKPGHGKIIDKNKPRQSTANAAGERSEVVELTGIVDGHRGEMEDAELMQKIGDEWKRYGRIVQILVCWMEDEDEDGGQGKQDGDGSRAKVYVLYADEASAMMAVNGGRKREVFEGNTTTARFYDRKRFEERDFEDAEA